MYNDTISDWFLQARDNVLNISRNRWMEIASSILFLILITRGRKLWLDFLTFAILLGGLIYSVYPQLLDSWVTGDVNDIHYELLRCIGFISVTWALGYFLVCKSTDDTTQTSYLLSFTVMLLCNLLMLGNQLANPPKKSTVSLGNELLVSKFYTLLLWTVGSLFYTVSAKDWGGYGEQRSHANFHLRVWFVMLLVTGVIDYAMPQWAIRTMFSVEKADNLHLLLMRSYACMVIGMAVLTYRAANFLRTSDKDALIVTHLFLIVVMALYTWSSLYSKWSSLSWKRIGSQFILQVVLLMNLFVVTKDNVNVSAVRGGVVGGLSVIILVICIIHLRRNNGRS